MFLPGRGAVQEVPWDGVEKAATPNTAVPTRMERQQTAAAVVATAAAAAEAAASTGTGGQVCEIRDGADSAAVRTSEEWRSVSQHNMISFFF